MKKLLLATTLFLTAMNASAAEEKTLESNLSLHNKICAKQDKSFRAMAKLKYAGVPITKIFSLTIKTFASQPDIQAEKIKQVKMAYALPDYRTKKLQDTAINNAANALTMACYK